MSTSKTWSKARVAPQARAEATEWFVSFREGEVDGAAREAFYSWLRKSPENVHAYLRITALWEDSGLLKPDELFDCEALLAKARQSSNVVGLDTAAARAMAPVAPERKRPLRFAWGAAAATLILAIGGLTVWTQRLKDTYATDIGEQRTLSLQDGSSVVLNATSRVRVRISENGRHIDLLEGQAIFRVARDPTRPFIVHSGATAVRAVGTQFEVYRKAARTIVTVLEGRVAVEAAGNALLTAGQQVTVASTKVMTPPTRTDVDAATAWTRGKLIFDEAPLSEVIAEFNRYSARRLIVDDPELQKFHISGVFPSSDPGRVAELLRQRFGATLQQSGDEIRVVRP